MQTVCNFMPWSRRLAHTERHVPHSVEVMALTEQKLQINGILGNRTHLAPLTFPQLPVGARPPKIGLNNGDTLYKSLAQGLGKPSCQ